MASMSAFGGCCPTRSVCLMNIRNLMCAGPPISGVNSRWDASASLPPHSRLETFEIDTRQRQVAPDEAALFLEQFLGKVIQAVGHDAGVVAIGIHAPDVGH